MDKWEKLTKEEKLKNLTVGCKIYVKKENEFRIAEVLQSTTRRNEPLFYVHYQEFNKRLDEWVKVDRLDLSKPFEFPKVETKSKRLLQTKNAGIAHSATSNIHLSNNKTNNVTDIHTTNNNTSNSGLNIPANNTNNKSILKKNKKDSIVKLENHTKLKIETKSNNKNKNEIESSIEDEDMMDLDKINESANKSLNANMSREQEIEKLRISGSMSQNKQEVARVRNFEKIQFGEFEIEPWYFSPYPVELTECEILYICQFCLCFFGSAFQFGRHRLKCNMFHPPGNEIYRDDVVSFFEIDGRRQRTWCRNLCLLSKLFLDHKTLYYDVDPFLFYCMTKVDQHGHKLLGYFSKEKESAESYNVACILTIPGYQREGYGRLLIAFSYELSKKEKKLGSPEKPLSDLGLLSYRAFWADTIVDALIKHAPAGDITIEELSSATAMTTNDVLHTLQALGMLRYYKGQHIICLTNAVLEQHEKQKKRRRRTIDPSKLRWKPPLFTAAQLRFAW